MFTCGKITLHFRNKSKKTENLVGDISKCVCVAVRNFINDEQHTLTHAKEAKLKPLFFSLLRKV